MVDNAEDAYDVVQEAFLNAYQSLENFKGDSLFFTWLYRIAVNTAISLKRKQRAVVSIDAGRERRTGHRSARPVGDEPAGTRAGAGGAGAPYPAGPGAGCRRNIGPFW